MKKKNRSFAMSCDLKYQSSGDTSAVGIGKSTMALTNFTGETWILEYGKWRQYEMPRLSGPLYFEIKL